MELTADKTSEPLLNVLCKDDNYEQALKRTSISESFDMHVLELSDCCNAPLFLDCCSVCLPNFVWSGHVTSTPLSFCFGDKFRPLRHSIATFEFVVLIGQ